MSTRRPFSKKTFRSHFGLVHGYFLVNGLICCWRLTFRGTYADGIVGFKDRAMHYEIIFSVLLLLLSYGLDDCDSATK